MGGGQVVLSMISFFLSYRILPELSMRQRTDTAIFIVSGAAQCHQRLPRYKKVSAILSRSTRPEIFDRPLHVPPQDVEDRNVRDPKAGER